MLFDVRGARLDNGQDFAGRVEATDPEVVKSLMHARGVAVESIRPANPNNVPLTPAGEAATSVPHELTPYVGTLILAVLFFISGSVSFLQAFIVQVRAAPVSRSYTEAAEQAIIIAAANAASAWYCLVGGAAIAVGAALLMLRQIAINTRPSRP